MGALLNPAAFKTPRPDFGNLSRNALRPPGYWQADLMFSRTASSRRARAFRRVEIFNIANV